MTTYYSLDDGELRISRDDPSFEWQGRVDSMPVVHVHPSPDGSTAVLLLEAPTGAAPVQNLVEVDAEANVVWRGELPSDTSADCFVRFDVEEKGDISAATWSGYRVVLSGATGQLLDRRFTK
jgi:hypothetical protein